MSQLVNAEVNSRVTVLKAVLASSYATTIRGRHPALQECIMVGSRQTISGCQRGGRKRGGCMLPIVLCVAWGWMTSVNGFKYLYFVEVPHGFFHFTNEIWQVNSFYYVAKFSIVWFMCFFERIRSTKNNFRSLVCWLSSATVPQWVVISILNRSCGTQK